MRPLSLLLLLSLARTAHTPLLARTQLCPPTLQLASWAAQFFVSRARIVANARTKYARVKELLEVPEGHWLGEEGASCASPFSLFSAASSL